ncbi:MAG TPA: hypothetical protein DDZ88_30990 [Verrucomicrobiales bacterium]|nr:hypothetical protein [Verrucomicrobiales bacterium]
MTFLTYILLCIFIVSVCSYVSAFSGALSFWGQKLADIASEDDIFPSGDGLGYQRLLSPNKINKLKLLSIVGNLAALILGVIYFGWYVGLAAIPVILTVSTILGLTLYPKSSNSFYRNQIIADLIRQQARFVKAHDLKTAFVIYKIIQMFNRFDAYGMRLPS